MDLMAPTVPEPVLQARSLYRFYRAGDEETLALQGVSLALRPGEFVTGPSGSGKSTLLACVAGMDNPDGGSVHVAGQRISHRREPERAHIRARHIGVLFQQDNLLDHLTVRNNLALVRSLAGRRGRADRPDMLGLLACQTGPPPTPASSPAGSWCAPGWRSHWPTGLHARHPTPFVVERCPRAPQPTASVASLFYKAGSVTDEC
jgi:putative ABC transport system ATP-binding protein